MEFERIADKKRLEFILDAAKASVPDGGNILDIGCGNGIITRALGAAGFIVTGIDSSATTIQTALAHNTLPNVHFKVASPGDALAPQSRYFDAVVCSEVLEHLHEPATLLGSIHSALKDNGVIAVTVPNGKGPRELLVTRPVQYLQQKDNLIWKAMHTIKRSLGYTGATIQSSAEDLRHIQFFTKRTLEKLALDNHFEIVEFRSANFLEQVFPFSLLARRSALLQKLDCRLADLLPYRFSSGFMTVWRKK